jgi:diamine N-acetyltransferase
MALRNELKAIDAAYWRASRVYFKPLKSEADLIYACYDCQLTDEQKELVNPAWFSIGRAYLAPEDNYPCLICSEQGEPVGFINLDTWLGEGDAYSWSFFIDKREQGKGYGKAAARLAIRLLKAADPEKPIKLAAERDNERAQRLYASLGFQLLPELDGDDLVFGL